MLRFLICNASTFFIKAGKLNGSISQKQNRDILSSYARRCDVMKLYALKHLITHEK